MSLAIIHSRALAGVNAPEITVEVHISAGLPALSIVGLPELAVRESKDRVRAALLNANFEFPARRITVNLAPADLPKEGGRYDLAIALGILAASRQLPLGELHTYEFIGELSLGGELRPVRGALPAALHCAAAGRRLLLPEQNAGEASLAGNCEVLPATTLLDVCAHLGGQRLLTPATRLPADSAANQLIDLIDVRGQPQAKRALEIAAAGEHNLLMIGPPGTGKTMLASRMPGILPPMTSDEALESAAIYSISDETYDARLWGVRRFRAPHHTASAVALVGGGSIPRPGEISLAHNGVLFLDELPEFDRKVLEVLREPLEKGRIVISRAARQAEFPARFQLIAAMNPCPCGYLGDPRGQCRCNADQIARYRQKISGPIMDRIDLHVVVPRLPPGALQQDSADGESSVQVRLRVQDCRSRQMRRAGVANARMSPQQTRRHCRLDDSGRQILQMAIERLGLSARAHDRILKVARTIADLDACETVTSSHVSEAIGYRSLDR